MRALLLGAGGMLARDIIGQKPQAHELLAFTRAELDIRDTASVQRVLCDVRPDWTVNASGFTNVDAAEQDRETAFAINGKAVGELAQLCRAVRCVLLHYSTDYVFDGTKDGYYSEDDVPLPVNVYGESKLDGETRVRDSGARHLVVRTQWLFGRSGKSFLSRIWEHASTRVPSRASDDQFGCVTYTVDLARTSWELMEGGFEGTYHVANRGRVNRYMVARQVFDALGAAHLLSACRSSEFPTVAQRPVSTPMSVQRVERALGRRSPEWTDAVDRYLQTLAAGSVAT